MSDKNDDLDQNPFSVPFPSNQKLTRPNYIRTTKYTLLTFLPLNIYYQFQRFYNIFFLLGALTVASGASSLSPATQIMPLIFVFVFSAGKEAIEDYARYAADTRANNVPYSIIRNGTIHKELSMNIRPGDIFYVEKGEKFPVDAMLISSSYEDGTCFVETAELDGETNLKRRSAVMETCKLNRAELVAKISGKIECEHPNENLNVFTGRAIINHAQDILNTNANSRISPDGSVTIPLNMNNILLRGAVLRNTDFAFGLVIYTGKNTKIIRNLKKSKQKTSKLEGKVNYFTLCAFGYFLALLISSVILEVTKYRDMYNKEKALKAEGITDYIVQWYIGEQDTSPSKVHHTQK